MNANGTRESRDGSVERLRRLIEATRPAAIAGWADYWARLTGLPVTDTACALELLRHSGEIRAVALEGKTLYVADAPHMRRAGSTGR